MTIDRTPAHLSDMPAFVRELRALVDVTTELAAVEDSLADHLAKRGDA